MDITAHGLYTIDELIKYLQILKREYGGNTKILPYSENYDLDFDFEGFGIIDEELAHGNDFRVGQLGMFLLG